VESGRDLAEIFAARGRSSWRRARETRERDQYVAAIRPFRKVVTARRVALSSTMTRAMARFVAVSKGRGSPLTSTLLVQGCRNSS